MSGILQRIAASAIRPQPRVHPFVESIFAVPREEGFATPILQQEIQSASVPSSKTPPADAQTSQPAAMDDTAMERSMQRSDQRLGQRKASIPAQPIEARVADNATLLPTAASSAGREGFQPLLPQPTHPEQEKEASTLTLQATVVPESAARPSAPEWPSSAVPPAASSPAWRFAPLVSEVGDEDKPTSAVPAGEARSAIAAKRGSPVQASSTVPGRGPVSGARNARGQRAPQPQTDEIQIHIGRIEVIATPPPAPRALAAPVRRSQSLDEYLRRSNGRAG
jgi:hypothetical protein